MSLFPIIPASVDPITKSATANAVDTGTATNYTFSSQAIGTADAARVVVVCVSGYSSTQDNTISSLTIGGVSAALVVNAGVGDSAEFMNEIWAAVVPTGTTGDVVVNNNNSCLRQSISVYALYGASGATASYTQTDATQTAPSATISVPSGGVLIGATSGNTSSSPKTFTWTNLTEDVDQLIESEQQHGSASDLHATTGGSVTVTATQDSAASADSSSLALASWGP